METTLKQCVGIDISKSSFTVCVCRKMLTGEIQMSQVEEFENNKNGFNRLVKWSRKITIKEAGVLFLMEATGIYYEGLAYHLHKLKLPVSVILPNKVKHYAKSLNIKTKTDIVDARVIAHMGAERQHPLWEPPATIFKQLRDLTRLYNDLKQERTVYLNRLESENASAVKMTFVINSNRTILEELEKQIGRCEKEIEKVLYAEDWLAEKINKLITIKGVGLITLAIIIAETQGFALIKSRKQLASYAGYDIVYRDSGTSIKGKTHISKKGNSRIRASLYFPALVAARYNPDLKEDYLRINIEKPSKMVGATALQRKLLLLIYTLWKKNETFIEEKNRTSGDQEIKLLLRHRDEVPKKAGNPKELPAQDELPYDLSTEVLLRQLQSS
jgi:transposase